MKKGLRLLFCCFIGFFILIPKTLYGRTNEEINLNRVIDFLKKESIPYEKRPLLAALGGFGSSILVTSGGNSTGTLVIAVPLGADFAVETALALSLMRHNNVHFGEPDIIVAFLGDEQNILPVEMGGDPYKGLRDLLSLNDLPENWVLCYLDAALPPEKMIIRYRKKGYVTPLEIIKPLPNLFNKHNIPWSFKTQYSEIFMPGNGPETISIAWEEEINNFVLTGESRIGELRPKESGGNDAHISQGNSRSGSVSPENLAGLLLEYSGAISFPLLETDRHYSVFSFPGGNVFFRNERFTAALLLISAGFLLLLFLFISGKNNAGHVFHMRLFFRFIWVFSVLLLLFMVSIKLSGLLYMLLVSLFDTSIVFPNYWGAIFAFFLSILFFTFFTFLLNFFRSPRRAEFYGASAVIFVLFGLFLAVFLDFSYVPVFLWTFLFVFLGALFKSPALVFACVLFTPLFPVVGTALGIAEAGSVNFYEFFVSAYFGNGVNRFAVIQIALLILPLFLLIKRGIILIQKLQCNIFRVNTNRKMKFILVPVLITAVISIMAVQILYFPKRQIPDGKRYLSTAHKKEILETSLSDKIFQGSRIITIRLSAKADPVRFDVWIESQDKKPLLTVYSASVPVTRNETGEKLVFILGEFPPNPLVTEIVVPNDFEGILYASAVYNKWDGAIDPEPPPEDLTEKDNYILIVNDSVILLPAEFDNDSVG